MKTRFLRTMLCVLILFSAFTASGQPVMNSPLLGATNYTVSVTATPDDNADDTQIVQAALNLVHARGGGEVVFTRPGVYNYTAIYCTGGAVPTAPNTTLNSALVIYDNTTIRSVPGVIHKLGVTKDDSRCYLLRNADPTNGNSNIVIDGGYWFGGGIVAEATSADGTHVTIPGDYASRLGAGVPFSVSDATAKTTYTSTGASYSSGSTTVTVASGAKAGGFQSSWQAADTQQPAIATINSGTDTITLTGDWTPYITNGSTGYIYGNSDTNSNKVYTVSSVSYANPTTTVVFSTDIPGTVGTSTKGNYAPVYNRLWPADMIRLENVDNLIIRNTKAGGVDKFAWQFIKVTNAMLSNNWFDNGSDGFHINGGCQRFTIRDVRGRTLDNMVALVCDEVWYRPQFPTLKGNITNILVDGLFLDSGKTCLEPVRCSGTSTTTIAGVTLRNLYGTVGLSNGIRIGDDISGTYGNLDGCTMKDFLIDGVAFSLPSGTAVVNLSGYNVKNVIVRNIRLLAANNIAVQVASASGFTTATDVESLIIDGIQSQVDSTVRVIQIDATVDYFSLANSFIRLGVSGTGLQVTNTSSTQGQIKYGSISNTQFVGNNATGGNVAIGFRNTTLRSKVNISETHFRQVGAGAMYGFQVSGPAEASLDGCQFDLNSSCIGVYNNNAATAFRLSGGSLKFDKNANNNYKDDSMIVHGSGSISPNNPGFTQDMNSGNFAAVSAPADGDVFYNTGAYAAGSGGAPGPGLMIYDGNGTFWRAVTPPKPVAVTSTGTTVISAYHSGMTFTNAGGSSVTTTYTLPAAKIGMTLSFINASGNTTTLNRAGSDTMQNPTTGATTATTMTTTDTGGTITLKCTSAGIWSIVDKQGTFTMVLPKYEQQQLFDFGTVFDSRRLAA